MVFDVSTLGQDKRPRLAAQGKLIGMQSDSSKCKIYEPTKGKFSWVKLTLVVGKRPDGSDKFLNITAYDIDLEKMPILKRADELLRERVKPLVKLEYYVSEKDAIVNGTQVMEESVELRNGKEVIIQKPKKWVNNRMSDIDVVNTFMILLEDANKYSPVEEKPINIEYNTAELM